MPKLTIDGRPCAAADGATIKKAAVSRGMLSLREDGAMKVLKGITTIEEVVRETVL